MFKLRPFDCMKSPEQQWRARRKKSQRGQGEQPENREDPCDYILTKDLSMTLANAAYLADMISVKN